MTQFFPEVLNGKYNNETTRFHRRRCEERSDEAISKMEIATPSARNDIPVLSCANLVVKEVSLPRIQLLNRVLASNDALAEEFRKQFDKEKITAINVMSAPGSGKTALIEKTVAHFKNKLGIFVIEGDIKGDLDAKRVMKAGGKVTQINTDGACHLDAFMLSQVLNKIDYKKLDLLIVENVGNLVCPAEFNLGTHYNVMLLSTPEGVDKPTKYPLMFSKADLLIINKIDLMPYVDFDIKALEKALKIIRPSLEIIKVSCKTGEGLADWYRWLTNHMKIN